MKIVCIAGSLRENSFSAKAAKLALEAIKKEQVEADLVDLKELSLPFCDGSRDYPKYPDLLKLKDSIKTAQGLLIVTPEYHGSMSGVLKNALDLLDEEHFRGKAIAIIAVMGGIPSNNAVNTLRIIFRQLHAWVLPEQLIISNADVAFDKKGELVDTDLSMRLREMVKHLVTMTKKLL